MDEKRRNVMDEKRLFYGKKKIPSQIRRYMEEKQVSYEIACIADDIINNYNISP